MRHRRVSVPLGFALVCLFLSALVSSRQRLQAQTQTAPAGGTAVAVKMVDAVDSGSDPAGKKYRAFVTKAVNAGNGVAISQGAAATITLASSGSGWTAQLSSVTIDGQPVAVTSSSANVSSNAQSATGSAANAVGSVLGGFGHHANVPASVPAVAMGQRVVLPPGTTLNFVLAATAPTNAPPATANATPPLAPAANAAVPIPAAAPTSGRGSWYQCRSWGENGTHQTVYVTPFIQTDAAASTIHQAYYTYMHATYPVDKLLHESDFCRQASTDAGQRTFQLNTQEKQWATSNPPWEVIHIDWTYTAAGPAAGNAAVAAAVPTAAASNGGPFISCSTSGGAGVDTYFTGVFQTAYPVKHLPNGGNLVDQSVLDRFYAYLTQKGYTFKPGSNYGCDVKPTEAEAKAAQHKRAYEGGACSTCGKIVETGWKETP
jgi:hypothetical protein